MKTTKFPNKTKTQSKTGWKSTILSASYVNSYGSKRISTDSTSKQGRSSTSHNIHFSGVYNTINPRDSENIIRDTKRDVESDIESYDGVTRRRN